MWNDSKTRITKKQAVWLEHLRACEASGETLAGYATSHDLRPEQLYRWKGRLRAMGLLGRSDESHAPAPGSAGPARTPADLGFVAARVAADEDWRSGLRIRFRNGVVLEVGAGCDREIDADLLSHLATLP